MTFEELAQQIANGTIKAPFCGLCGRAANHTAAFLPPEGVGAQLGQPPGKTRMIIYGVCDACMDKHGRDAVSERMEELILKQGRVH